MRDPITVSQINRYIKGLIEEDTFLDRISVKGEISNLTYHRSGHIYFTLKDTNSQLGGVMFKSRVATGLKFQMKDGDKVVVTGSIQVYEASGRYQIYADRIEADGVGDLYQKFLALKNELEEMGMFDQLYKKPIPHYVKKIGIVTAPTGAAVRDIIHISKRRNPYIKLVLFPALVQGEGAPASIVKGIKTLDSMDLDVLIVGRGGGSIEDLWAFNDREVADAIFSSQTPIISAVGHETDFTIADFVADLRASTPSAAAEMAVSLQSDLEERILNDKNRLEALMQMTILAIRNRTEIMEKRLEAKSPQNRLKEYREKMKAESDRLFYVMKRVIDVKRAALPREEDLAHSIGMKIEKNRKRLIINSGKLDALSPMKKLRSGYGYPETMDGKHIMKAKDLSVGEQFKMTMEDGIIKARAEEITEDNSYGE
ncbi:MAG: exodeoxyribonuclease VII large subunit [Lachnospiraceae bacterium]|nr:exodeoxyribonuclease VII large subunit [Lachnospiraceae bacterium]